MKRTTTKLTRERFTISREEVLKAVIDRAVDDRGNGLWSGYVSATFTANGDLELVYEYEDPVKDAAAHEPSTGKDGGK